jgi:hypothetical protein
VSGDPMPRGLFVNELRKALRMNHSKRRPVLAIVVALLAAFTGAGCDKLKPPAAPVPVPKTNNLPPVQPPPASTEVPPAASAVR